MIGIIGAAAQTNLAVSAISGGLKKNNQKEPKFFSKPAFHQKSLQKRKKQNLKFYVKSPKSGLPRREAERA